jgi:hypothetical protein
MTARRNPVACLFRTALAATLLFANVQAQAADPVAFLSDVRGDVTIDGNGRPPFLAELLPGTTLVLGTGGGAAVMYVVSGEEFAFRGPGEFVVTRSGVKSRKGAAPSIRTPALRASTRVLVDTSRAATASLRMRSAAVPRQERAGLLYPVNARIATLHPVLRWLGEPGARYSVAVTGADGKEVFRGIVRETSLRLPVRLKAAASYAWRCTAGDEVLGEARFETLPAEAISTADRARSSATTFGDRVIFAMVLRDLGSDADSREVWSDLAAERPDIPELAGLSR